MTLQDAYNILIDLDELLQFLYEQNIGYSDEFRNIVRANIVDTMIDEYGEPYYTWIDREDSTNTGNADAKVQWYTNLFNRMQNGYKIIEKGLASSPEWIKYALEAGIVSMEQVSQQQAWKSIGYDTCTNITTQSDTSAIVARAEAEYNRAMREIEAKDQA